MHKNTKWASLIGLLFLSTSGFASGPHWGLETN